MRNQIQSYVLARLNIGFMGPDGWVLENCDRSIPLGMNIWQPDAIQLANAIDIPKKLNANAIGTLADYQTGTFHEYTGWEAQDPRGTSAQIFSISAFMNLCIRNGWLDAQLPRSRFW